MSRRVLLCGFVLPLVSWFAVLGSSPSGAAELAQKVVRVGFVDPYSPTTGFRGVDGFWQRLRELGWVEGQNLIIEARWANGRIDRLPALMAELVRRKVDVVVTYGTRGAIAAKNATSTIPIVAATMGDPIGSGLAVSLSHPGGNLTGLSLGWTEGMAGKRLQLLREAVPNLSTFAMIADPGNPVVREMAKELAAIAPAQNMKALLVEVRQPQDLDRAFKRARGEAQALLVLGDYFTFERRQQIAALAARYRVPVMYPAREYTDSGGLMAYGVDNALLFRRAADYVDKILHGAKPADLPIEQPTQYEFVVNLRTAKALGLTIPEPLLLRADEVIK